MNKKIDAGAAVIKIRFVAPAFCYWLLANCRWLLVFCP
jgi:hypothetical protein